MIATSPEATAAIWATLDGLAQRIGDAATRERYLSAWRERYDAEFPLWLRDSEIVRLPDWKHVGAISARERRQAEMVSNAWLEEAEIDPDSNDAAKRFAWDVGRRVAGGLMGAVGLEVLEDRLGTAITSPSIKQAFERGCADQAAGEGLLAAIVLDLRCARMPRTGDGLAQRFKARHGHDFRHTTAKGWLKWDDKRWKVLDEERGVVPAELLAAVVATLRAIQREARSVRATGLAEGSVPEGADPMKFKVEVDGVKVAVGTLDSGPDGLDGLAITPSTCRLSSEALARFGRAREEDASVKAVANLARDELTVRIQDFDTDPLTINCQNGTLRLKRLVERDGTVRAEAELAPHAREDLLTKIANVPYDPEARCPLYDDTVVWAQPKPEMRRYLHQWGGYNLTGDMGAQIFHIWHGPLAQNGKSTLLDSWAECAGDYAAGGKIETFMEVAQARSGDAATPALAKLPGVRMLRTGEPPKNAKFDESLINAITGQDPTPVRDNFRSFAEVKMQFKLTVACNKPPSIPGGTEGIKRRVKVVPFEQTMKGATNSDGSPKRIENFVERLKPEMPGIFGRLIAGARDWLAHGFAEPGDVTEWTEEYKEDNDPLGRFLSYCTEPDAGSNIQASKLYELFGAWSKATGGPTWTDAYIKSQMHGRGFKDKRSNGIRYQGLKAIRTVGEFIDDDGKVRDLPEEAFGGGAASARANEATGPPPAYVPADWPDLAPDAPPPADIDDDIPF